MCIQQRQRDVNGDPYWLSFIRAQTAIYNSIFPEVKCIYYAYDRSIALIHALHTCVHVQRWESLFYLANSVLNTELCIWPSIKIIQNCVEYKVWDNLLIEKIHADDLVMVSITNKMA